jgi:hypothetical protein
VGHASGHEESLSDPKILLRFREWLTPLCPTPFAFRLVTPPVAHSPIPSSPIRLWRAGCRDHTPIEYHVDPAIPLVVLA